jgi:hypothetical protein
MMNRQFNVFLEFEECPHFDTVFNNIPMRARMAALNGFWLIPEVSIRWLRLFVGFAWESILTTGTLPVFTFQTKLAETIIMN